LLPLLFFSLRNSCPADIRHGCVAATCIAKLLSLTGSDGE
jgi:hypothetical protein